MGNRAGIVPGQLDRYVDAGFVVVSIDYRLAPETKLPAIAEDVEDAFRWLRSSGVDEFGIDPDRIGVVGHSAGGYLTLLAGHRVDPAPSALVSFYGYGNIAGDWYSKPDPFYNTFDRLSKDNARRAIGEDELVDGAADPARRDYYLWCLTWTGSRNTHPQKTLAKLIRQPCSSTAMRTRSFRTSSRSTWQVT